MVTMKEIAQRCGCSTATVSKALNRMSDISPETIERIQKAADEMGYHSNAAAKTLRTNRSRVIDLLLYLRTGTVWMHEYFSQVASAIETECESLGYDITPINCITIGKQMEFYQYCRYRCYDGVIAVCAGFSEESLHQFIQGKIPIVTIDQTHAGRSSVSSDNLQGMRELTRYVCEKGHRKIAFIHGDQSPVTQARLDSFLTTCREFGITIPPSYIVKSLYHDPQRSAAATKRLLALPDPPTCILYPDDYSYLGGKNVLDARGLKIPEDISVAGYDGITILREIRPQLTTMKQDSDRIGQHAAHLVIEAIEHPNTCKPRHITFPGTLLPGDTVLDLSEAKRK